MEAVRKETFLEVAGQLADESIEAMTAVMEEFDELMGFNKSPETLLNKKYEEMTPLDKRFLYNIMGQEKFEDWYKGKELAIVQELEAE